MEAAHMKQWKPVLLTFSLFIIIIITIPALLVLPFSSGKETANLDEAKAKQTANKDMDQSMQVAVYRSNDDLIEKLPLEQYVVGVVAGEMPADFEPEALKAQALAARTYIVNQLLVDDSNVPKGADVTDTVAHQVYKNEKELAKLWGADYEWKIKKIKDAVHGTMGKVLTYKDKPITAAFFSTSNGYTENSESYWENELPYLRSVESPWDSKSPKFEDQVVIKTSDFQKKLGVTLPKDGSVGTITGRTEGKRVANVEINGKKFTGREIRDKLNLKSSDFTWSLKGSHIVISTKGFGHGVGMSQYGANGMAEEGKDYKQIVQHYYKDVKITQADTLLKKVTAQR